MKIPNFEDAAGLTAALLNLQSHIRQMGLEDTLSLIDNLEQNGQKQLERTDKMGGNAAERAYGGAYLDLSLLVMAVLNTTDLGDPQ